MANAPGVLFYYDIRPALSFLNESQKGKLFDTILDYGEYGNLPDFADDPLLGMAWSFILPRIDRDAESYDFKVDQRRYAGYCSAAKKKEIEPISFEEWRGIPEEARKDLLSGSNGR